MRVLIIGGGLGGLCLANGLHKEGIQVRVFEKHVSAEASRNLGGYFIHLEAQGLRALQRCLDVRGWADFNATSTSTGAQWAFRDTDLQLLAMRDDVQISGKSLDEVGRRAIERWELRNVLLDALGPEGIEIVQWNKTFSHYEVLEDGMVRAYFQDGTSEDGDVLIGADGSKSAVRRQRFPEMKREDLGIVAICGCYPLTGNRSQELPSLMTDCSLNNIVPYGKGWMFLSSWRSRHNQEWDGKHQGSKQQSEPVDYTLWAYFVPKQDTPANIAKMTATELRDLVSTGVQGWAPPIEKVVRDAKVSTISPIYLHCAPHLDNWPPSSVTLLGDAIHNMTPAAGIGANTALRDAHILTDLFSTRTGQHDVPDTVADYESRMREYANAAVALSKQIAENASSSAVVQRYLFRMLLRLAQASPFVMRATIGRGAVQT